MASSQLRLGVPPAPTTSGPRFTVSGVVVNSVTGEPLPRALVVTRGAEQHTAFTGQDGRFQMEGVVQGTWFFTAQKPGFLDSNLTNLNRSAVKIGSDTSLITVKLAPESMIDGRVVDRDGEGIEGLQVQCMMQMIMNGRKTWQMSGGSQTDETGNFHLQTLRPGAYILKTNSQPLFPSFNYQNQNSTLPLQVYPPHFYPEAADLASVQPLIVRPGETARADFSITPVAAFRVSGSVNPSQGGIMGSVLSSDGEQVLSGFATNPRGGTWTAPPLPPGSWTIMLMSRRGQDFSYYAQQTVNVTSSDIKNVQMTLEPLPSIAVNVASSTPANQRQVQIELMADSQVGPNGRVYGSSRNPQNMNETPVIRDVPPGAYSVFVRPYGSECVAAVSSGGTDLMRNPLVISAGSPPSSIDVTLEDNCASMQGQVHMDTPAADASVILVAASRAIPPQTVSLQSDGGFTISRLSPGDYRLYAVSNTAGLEFANPDAMRQIDGASVTVSAKQKANVTLNLVMRDAN